MRKISTNSHVNRVACALAFSAAVLAGCSSSSSDSTPDTITQTPTSQLSTDSIEVDTVADQIANDASLGGSVLQIQTLVKERSLTALAGLNQAFTAGTLTPTRLDCVDEDAGFPILEYFCGEDGVGDRLTDFGYPAFVLSVEDTTECRNSLVNNDPVAGCVLRFSDSEQAGEWFVKYSLNSVDGLAVETLTLADGVVPEFVEFDESSPVCEIDIIDSNDFEYSDEAVCRVSVAQVLSILQRP